MKVKYPPPLKRGDKVALAAPAGPVDKARFDWAVEALSERGLVVSASEEMLSKDRYLAGNDGRRLGELQTALSDPEIKAVFLARGGYGTQRIIPSLDLPADAIPKPVAGFSDNTALLGALSEIYGWAVVHGPHPRKGGEEELDELLGCLGFFGEPRLPVFTGLKALNGGADVEGPLCGGCLSLISTSVSTPYAIRAGGKIVFIEEVCEAVYRIDRMLHHLLHSGFFEGAKGVVFGTPETFIPEGGSIEDLYSLLGEFAGKAGIPVLTGLPCGHVGTNRPLPFGPRAHLSPARGELAFLEPAVR
ncbi:LD-carboxypeptidase [bacterium]|nr:MAG: LD-carboxypeptidase [bacterium]